MKHTRPSPTRRTYPHARRKEIVHLPVTRPTLITTPRQATEARHIRGLYRPPVFVTAPSRWPVTSVTACDGFL
jgi:hypothetical protein